MNLDVKEYKRLIEIYINRRIKYQQLDSCETVDMTNWTTEQRVKHEMAYRAGHILYAQALNALEKFEKDNLMALYQYFTVGG